MKKIIVCLLLVCIIGLGCFMLVSCDDGVNDGTNNAEPKIEFVKNEDTSTGTSTSNKYTFRLWYPYQWFVDGYEYFGIKCSLSPNEESSAIYPIIYAEYLYRTDTHSWYFKKPDSWVYFEIELDAAPEIIYFKVHYYDEVVLLQTSIDLKDTYKTA